MHILNGEKGRKQQLQSTQVYCRLSSSCIMHIHICKQDLVGTQRNQRLRTIHIRKPKAMKKPFTQKIYIIRTFNAAAFICFFCSKNNIWLHIIMQKIFKSKVRVVASSCSHSKYILQNVSLFSRFLQPHTGICGQLTTFS